MEHNKETKRTFVRNQLKDAPDLSALTLGILKRQYMSHVGCESLNPEEKTCIKRVVEEELLMQISGTDVSESENASVGPSNNKRKRGEDEEANSGRSVDEDESSAKKIRRRSTSSGRAGKGKHVELNGKSFETGCAGSKEEEQVDQNGDKDHWLVLESEDDQDSAEEQMDISDKPQYRKGPAGDPLEGKQKVGKRERQPRSRKRQTKASSDEEKESSSSLSDEISEEEDKDSKKKVAPGNKLVGKQKDSKGGGEQGSGKQQATAPSDEENESSPQSNEESEEDENVPKKKEAPGNILDGKEKGATGGKKTGSGKQQAKASAVEVKKESSSSQSDKESEVGDKYKKGKEPGDKLDGKQKVGKRGRKTVTGRKQTKAPSYEEKQPSFAQSGEDGKEDKHPKENTPKQDGGNSEDSDDDYPEGELLTTKTKEDAHDPDSSSSSLTSLEDEKGGGGDSAPAKKLTKKKGDKKKRKDDSKRETEENKAVLRLKRYISLCGTRRNYKKLFEGCRSIRSKVAVLKKELEDLGVEGVPTIEKCKKARLKREEAKELADLDVSNIIATQGRPKRRGPSDWQEPPSSPAARYKRTVNSDSDEGSPTEKVPNGSRHWGNLKGIISDDGDSD